MYMFINVYRYI